MSSTYLKRGASASKEDVHAAVSKLDQGVFPGAFCKALPGATADEVMLLHADGAGTKSSLAYLYWKETGDTSVFRGIARDALIMNIDDLLCVGALENFVISSTIGRNKHRIDGKIISEIISATEEFINLLNTWGAKASFAGGETADLGDLVRTVIVDSTVLARMPKKDFIDAGNIKAGQVIVGLSSYGKSNYENIYNSGMGSNGLTSARHDLLKNEYAKKYPETWDDATDPTVIYQGKYSVTDLLAGTELDIGKAVLSTTRTYYPVIKEMLATYRSKITGLIHCSGGGLTKSMKFGKSIHYVKDDLFALPPLFTLLAEKNDPKEMAQVFNCGQRMEIYTDEKTTADLIKISESYGVEAKVIGHTEVSTAPNGKNMVTIRNGGNEICY